MTGSLWGAQALALLGHELRRPLTVIRGAATLLLQSHDEMPAESRRAMLELIDGSVEAMSELIDDLLTAVHLDAGDLRVDREPADAGRLVAELVEGMRIRLPGRSLQLDRPAGPVPLETDVRQATRIFRALIDNALKASPPGAPVEVSLRTAGSEVRFEVLDRGPGIPTLEERARAFEPFAKLDQGGAGAGLGLYLAGGLVRLLGGQIGIDERPGGGARVWVTLRRRG